MLHTLQHLIAYPKKEFLLFDETQHSLFLAYALPLLETGISVGAIATDIVKSLNIPVKHTAVEGIFTYEHPLSKPSILCFSSGTKNRQKGIVRSYQSWQPSFDIIAKAIVDFPAAKAIVLGSLPYSLSMFGAMESIYRRKKPYMFSTCSLRSFDILSPNENYMLWATPSYCSFFINAVHRKQINPIETVKYVFVGGAQFSNTLRCQLQQVFPKAKIFSFYGASETSFIALKDPNDNSESVGTLCPGVKVVVTDKNNQQLPHNSTGTLWVKTNQQFDSYLQKDIKINQLNDFISVHDSGFIDTNNRLFFSGRTARKVSISGHVIDVNELEKWYKNELEKEDVTLLVRPNIKKEYILILCTKYPIDEIQWQLLKKNAFMKLGAQGVPKKWVHCPEWPLRKNGKIDIQKLKSQI